MDVQVDCISFQDNNESHFLFPNKLGWLGFEKDIRQRNIIANIKNITPIALYILGNIFPGIQLEPMSFICQICAFMIHSGFSKSSKPIKIKATIKNQPYCLKKTSQGII